MLNNNRKTALIAATVAALFIFAGNFIFNGGNVVIAGISALLGIPFFLLANAGFARYRASLAARAETLGADTAGRLWDVYMNGVIVGTIPDNTLAALQGEVANDWHNMAAQALNVLQVPLRMFDKFLVAIPAVAFWLILACALVAPNDLIQTFAAVRDASPREIHQGVSAAITVFCAVGLIAFVLNWMMTGYTHGLRNIYRERFGYLLRGYLKVAATGELVISRLANGTSYQYEPDVLGWLKARSRARQAERERKA